MSVWCGMSFTIGRGSGWLVIWLYFMDFMYGFRNDCLVDVMFKDE